MLAGGGGTRRGPIRIGQTGIGRTPLKRVRRFADLHGTFPLRAEMGAG
jgi:hypothetical protein